MDERYYIYGGLALLLLALVVYLFDSVARYRRAVRNARQAAVAPDAEGEAKYITDDDRASMALSGATGAPGTESPLQAAGDPPAAVDSITELYHSLDEPPHPRSERASEPEPEP
ncbi:MAG: hypothetical protein JW733_05390, partial [Coriobacteriia bacterium]|nr:hypothetical protein [Coriobacteriia bacterium]